MMRCLLLCGGNKEKEEKRARKEKRIVTLEEEKIVRWVVDDKEDWGREKEVEMVPKKFPEVEEGV